MSDKPYDPGTGRPPADPNDLRDPTTVPMWPIGFFGQRNPIENDDKTGISEIESRILGRLEETFKRLQYAERGTLHWGELLYECRGIKRAWDSLYAHPWKDDETRPKDESHPWNNEGCTHQGWKLQLDWQARLY